MYALDHTLPGAYHAAALRAEARRDGLARAARRTPSGCMPRRSLLRRSR